MSIVTYQLLAPSITAMPPLRFSMFFVTPGSNYQLLAPSVMLIHLLLKLCLTRQLEFELPTPSTLGHLSPPLTRAPCPQVHSSSSTTSFWHLRSWSHLLSVSKSPKRHYLWEPPTRPLCRSRSSPHLPQVFTNKASLPDCELPGPYAGHLFTALLLDSWTQCYLISPRVAKPKLGFAQESFGSTIS